MPTIKLTARDGTVALEQKVKVVPHIVEFDGKYYAFSSHFKRKYQYIEAIIAHLERPSDD